MVLENSKAMLSGLLWSVSMATDLANVEERCSRFSEWVMGSHGRGKEEMRKSIKKKEFLFLESLGGNLKG